MPQCYLQKCDTLKEDILRIEAELFNSDDLDILFDWIEQYKPFFSFKEIIRPILAYLVRLITVDSSKEVQIEFLHKRECRCLLDMINLL